MKAGWREKPLGKVANVVNGGTPRSKVAEYWDGDVQWLTPKDMGKLNSEYVETTPRTITQKGLSGSSAKLIGPNAIILSTRAPIGHLAITRGPMAFNQGCRGIEPDDDVDTRYLYYFLIMSAPTLDQLGTGTTFRELSARTLKEFGVPLPPLEEQRRIVAILDEAHEGLARARANIKANVADADELFTSTLRNVFDQTDDWVKEPLITHVRFVDYRGKTPPKSDWGIRLITAKNVKMGYVSEHPAEFVREDAYQAWMTRGIPDKGDVLFTTEAPLANVAQLDTDSRVVIGQRLITMQPQANKLRSGFLKFALMSPAMQKAIRAKATGATVTGIKAKLLKQIPLQYPANLDEQDRIIELCGSAFDATNTLRDRARKKLTDLFDLQQSLLERAFAGELT